jgi:hypothetical protein
MDKLTQEALKELLHYNPDSGIFTWLYRHRKYFTRDCDYREWNTRYPGLEAGGVSGAGYIMIGFFGKNHRSHRLAWLYMHGSWPNMIDHMNKHKTDNRIINLRDVTKTENSRNQKKSNTNTSGITGVYWCKRDKIWEVRITGENGRITRGMKDFFEACCLRKSLERRNSYHENHGGII